MSLSLLFKALLAGLIAASVLAVIWIFTAYANQQTIAHTMAANDYGAIWGVGIAFFAVFFAILLGESRVGQRIFHRLL